MKIHLTGKTILDSFWASKHFAVYGLLSQGFRNQAADEVNKYASLHLSSTVPPRLLEVDGLRKKNCHLCT